MSKEELYNGKTLEEILSEYLTKRVEEAFENYARSPEGKAEAKMVKKYLKIYNKKLGK